MGSTRCVRQASTVLLLGCHQALLLAETRTCPSREHVHAARANGGAVLAPTSPLQREYPALFNELPSRLNAYLAGHQHHLIRSASSCDDMRGFGFGVFTDSIEVIRECAQIATPRAHSSSLTSYLARPAGPGALGIVGSPCGTKSRCICAII